MRPSRPVASQVTPMAKAGQGLVRQHFDYATWLHKARQMPKEDFKKEVRFLPSC
jgi:hypothetical protein